MNGNRSSAYSRLFLALGTLVVAWGVFQLVRPFFRVRDAIGRTGSGELAGAVFRPLAGGRCGLLIACLAIAAVVVVAVCAGALRRRPWALGASVALFGLAAAAGLGVAVFQVATLMRGADRTPDALEIGYGPVLSYWRIASIAVGLLVAVFCGAAVARFLSEDTRREFRRPMS